MEKYIGTITFHWANNYGAVLQAYALQKYLKNKGYKTEIIDYRPWNVLKNEKLGAIKRKKINYFIKANNIRKFRNNEINTSKKTYRTNDELKSIGNRYNSVIVGSDQIWNEWFTLNGEGKITLSYFLNFINQKTRKISYAASFGTTLFSNEYISNVNPELKKFHKISVREKSGKVMMENLGFEATLVLDPTLLIDKKEYEKLIEKNKMKKKQKVFSYIIHEDQNLAVRTSSHIKKYYKEKITKNYYNPKFGVYEWLQNIKEAEIVVTNSFHGVVFSLILETPFIVIPVENSKMNDRINTLLSEVDLNDRIVNEFNEKNIYNLMNNKINWKKINIRLQKLRLNSEDFLLNNLN